ncbi:MAG: type II toxin-antitoxin system HicA family toxin [Bacteroidales bacterium]|nr:type II toxin-antitoxin system HicA family toxin [Bacteroidales bacterium]
MQDGWFVSRQSGSHMIMRHPKKMVRSLYRIMGQVKLVLGFKTKY